MGRITVTAVQPGMRLSSPVFIRHRHCLAAGGTVLDESKIALLQAWGVVEVEVEGVAEPSLEEIEARMARSPTLTKLSAEIDERFFGASAHEFLHALRRLVKQLALEEHGEQGNNNGHGTGA